MSDPLDNVFSDVSADGVRSNKTYAIQAQAAEIKKLREQRDTLLGACTFTLNRINGDDRERSEARRTLEAAIAKAHA